MDRPGTQLLSSAGFAQNQHARVASRHQWDLLNLGQETWTAADQLLEAQRLFDLRNQAMFSRSMIQQSTHAWQDVYGSQWRRHKISNAKIEQLEQVLGTATLNDKDD